MRVQWPRRWLCRRDRTGVRLFFVHIMRAGGTSFRHMLWDAVPADRIYPNRQDLASNDGAYLELEEFRTLPSSTFDRPSSA